MAASSRQRYVVVGGGIAGVSCAEEVRFVIKNERYSWKNKLYSVFVNISHTCFLCMYTVGASVT